MAARVLDCPQCGAPVTFQSSIAVFAVCEHCRSMVVLRGAALEALGVMAALPPDLSPFQIGTRGEWKGRGFEIVGRLRVEWEEGSWNEWCILYDAKTTGWLAEAQGLLMISFATPLTEKLPAEASFYAPNLQLQLNGATWTVTDAKTVKYRAAEGELPFAAPPDESRVSVDFIGAKGGFSSIEIDGKELELFTGEYAQFTALNLTNLRKVPGWDGEIEQEKGKTTALSCPSCGAAVNLRAAGQSMSAVCGSCGAIIDTATPELQVIQKADEAVRKLLPLLPIGQRGKLLGVDCEVIGFVSRTEDSSTWFEYLLFNPWLGFQWLVSFQGHWTIVDRLTSMPAESGNKVYFAGRTYKLFAKGTATVGGVLGEFYWKVQRGEQAEVADYIDPPEIVSGETYPGLAEVTWSHGKYITPKVVEEAFAVKDLPAPEGVYLNQPNPFAKKWREVRWPFFLSLPILFFVWAFTIPHEVKLLEAPFVFQRPLAPAPAPGPTVTPIPGSLFDTIYKLQQQSRPSATPTSTPISPPPTVDTQQTLVTPHFQLDGGDQRVEIEANAGVDNSWLDLDMDLVNAKTNETIPAPLEISYYHGYDSDGSWTEGDKNSSIALPAVPAGEYFLTIEPSADAKIDRLPFTVRVKSGGVFFGNCIVVLLLVMFYPIMVLWRGIRREKARWSESDFTP
jgi:ribosomal protein S27AE